MDNRGTALPGIIIAIGIFIGTMSFRDGASAWFFIVGCLICFGGYLLDEKEKYEN